MSPRYYIVKYADGHRWFWSGNPHTPEPPMSNKSVVWRGPIGKPSVLEAERMVEKLDQEAAARQKEKKKK